VILVYKLRILASALTSGFHISVEASESEQIPDPI